MEFITVSAVSTVNLIGNPKVALQNMDRCLPLSMEQGTELTLFPELNVSGFVFPSILYRS